MKICFFLFALMFSFGSFAADVNLDAHSTGIWSIAGTPTQNRWLIIHNLAEAKISGIYHIEVIGRGKKAPVWKIKHLANHIAMTKEALLASVMKPLNTGGVYPESFDDAFANWKQQNSGRGGVICTTTVLECMK